MNRSEIIPTIVLSGYALGRIATQDAGNEAPAAQWRVLNLLEKQGDARVGELAAAARTTQPGMTRLLGTLERDGLIARDQDPADSRAVIVRITGDGSAALAAWRSEFREVLAPRFSDLSDEEWATLERAAALLSARTAMADRKEEQE
jgi:DNA-binding MarR family transcriptional regulator